MLGISFLKWVVHTLVLKEDTVLCASLLAPVNIHVAGRSLFNGLLFEGLFFLQDAFHMALAVFRFFWERYLAIKDRKKLFLWIITVQWACIDFKDDTWCTEGKRTLWASQRNTRNTHSHWEKETSIYASSSHHCTFRDRFYIVIVKVSQKYKIIKIAKNIMVRL